MTLILEDGPLSGKQVPDSAVAAQCKMFITSRGDEHMYFLRRRLFGTIPGQASPVHVASVYGYVREAIFSKIDLAN